MTWDQRHWLEDFRTFPKCPRTWSKLKYWARYALEKLGNFCEMAKVNYPWNFIFDKRAPLFPLVSAWPCLPRVPQFISRLKIQINNKKWWNNSPLGQMVVHNLWMMIHGRNWGPLAFLRHLKHSWLFKIPKNFPTSTRHILLNF